MGSRRQKKPYLLACHSAPANTVDDELRVDQIVCIESASVAGILTCFNSPFSSLYCLLHRRIHGVYVARRELYAASVVIASHQDRKEVAHLSTRMQWKVDLSANPWDVVLYNVC